MKNKFLMLLLPLLMVGCGEVSSSLGGLEVSTSSEVVVTTEETTTSVEETTSSVEETTTSENQGTTSEENVTTSEELTTSEGNTTTSENNTTSEDQGTTSEVTPEVKYYTVSGVLKDSANYKVSNAKLKLFNNNYEQIQMTNNNGQFTFENVVAGTYSLSIIELSGDTWNLEKFSNVTVTVNGDLLEVVLDDVVIQRDGTVWGPIYG